MSTVTRYIHNTSELKFQNILDAKKYFLKNFKCEEVENYVHNDTFLKNICVLVECFAWKGPDTVIVSFCIFGEIDVNDYLVKQNISINYNTPFVFLQFNDINDYLLRFPM